MTPHSRRDIIIKMILQNQTKALIGIMLLKRKELLAMCQFPKCLKNNVLKS